MKIKALTFFIFILSWPLFSQKDSPFKSSKLKLEWESPTIAEPKNALPGIEYKSILDNKDSNLSRYSIKKSEKVAESILEKKSEFKNPGDEYKDKLNKEIGVGSAVDVFFGKFKVFTPKLKILTRDHMDPDGDRVRIIVNNVVVYLNIYLESSFKTHIIDLTEGDNLIDILALNQGLAGPNTATFAIYDEKDNLVTTNDWNLNTGLAAKFLIEYVKPMENKK